MLLTGRMSDAMHAAESGSMTLTLHHHTSRSQYFTRCRAQPTKLDKLKSSEISPNRYKGFSSREHLTTITDTFRVVNHMFHRFTCQETAARLHVWWVARSRITFLHLNNMWYHVVSSSNLGTAECFRYQNQALTVLGSFSKACGLTLGQRPVLRHQSTHCTCCHGTRQ